MKILVCDHHKTGTARKVRHAMEQRAPMIIEWGRADEPFGVWLPTPFGSGLRLYRLADGTLACPVREVLTACGRAGLNYPDMLNTAERHYFGKAKVRGLAGYRRVNWLAARHGVIQLASGMNTKQSRLFLHWFLGSAVPLFERMFEFAACREAA